jgi:hypothetical protein
MGLLGDEYNSKFYGRNELDEILQIVPLVQSDAQSETHLVPTPECVFHALHLLSGGLVS